MQGYRKAGERTLQPDLTAEGLVRLEKTLSGLVPQSPGNGIDQIVWCVGRNDPKRMEADRRRLDRDPRIGSGGYHRTLICGRAFSHLGKDFRIDRDQSDRRRRCEFADRGNGHATDQEEAVERAVLDIRGGRAGTHIFGAEVLFGQPRADERNAGISERSRTKLTQGDVPAAKVGESSDWGIVANHQLQDFRKQASNRTQVLQRSLGGEYASSRMSPADDVGLRYSRLDLAGGDQAEVLDGALRRLRHRHQAGNSTIAAVLARRR